MKSDILPYEQNPRSMLNLVSAQFREKILNLPKELQDKTEAEIIQYAQSKRPDWIPSEVDFGLRLNFWDEYNWAQKHNMQMRMSTLHEGVCNPSAVGYAVSTDYRLAYITCPFPSDVQKRKRALSLAWNDIVEILTMKVPINPRTNSPDPKILSLKADLFKYLHTYQHGLPEQKVLNKNLNLNAEVTQEQVTQAMDMATIDNKLKELEARSSKVLSPPSQPLPVESAALEAGRVLNPEFKR